MVKAADRREAVAALKDRGVSERRGCGLASISRAGYRYRARPRDNGPPAAALREYSRRHPREGCDKALVHARQKLDETVNHKRAERVWRNEGLTVPKKRRKRRRGKGVPQPPLARHPNHVWTMDFMEDSCADGRKLRFLAVGDEFTRENLDIGIGRSFKAHDVKTTLAWLFIQYGAPQFMRCDNGPEFVAGVVADWLKSQGVNTAHIEPGKPWQNGKGESFNGRFREECLNMEVFFGVQDARLIVSQWRRHYNHTRPRGSLGYVPPLEFKRRWLEQNAGTAFRQDLSPSCPKQGKRKKGAAATDSLPPASDPASALGTHPCVALSSGRATKAYDATKQ